VRRNPKVNVCQSIDDSRQVNTDELDKPWGYPAVNSTIHTKTIGLIIQSNQLIENESFLKRQ